MRNILLKNSHVVLFVLNILFSIKCNTNQKEIVVKSPNGEMYTVLKWENQDVLKYCILMGNDTLVSFSEMGVIVDGVTFGKGVEVVERVDSVIDETYSTLWNKSEIAEHCTYTRIKFLNKLAALHFWVEIKSFNNGIAFRYIIPCETERTIEGENTEFKIAGENQFNYASGPFQYGWLQESSELVSAQIYGKKGAVGSHKYRSVVDEFEITEDGVYSVNL